MRTLPKVSEYSLEPGRQSCCILEDPKHSPLQRQGVYLVDGACIRLERNLFLGDRTCQRNGTYFIV